MPVLYLKHPDIDRTQWDAVVERSRQRQVYALTWYLDVVAPGWEAVVELDAAGAYITVMPVPWRSRFGIRYIQQPLFCQQLGIYGLTETVAEATYIAFVQEVCQRFRYVSGYHFNTANKLPAGLPPEVYISQTLTLYLPLNKPYEQLYQGYTRDRKMNLKRAQKAELAIEESTDIEPVIRFFREQAAGRIYGGVSEAAYMQLRQLYEALRQRGIARLCYTTDASGRKNGGCLFVIWGGHIVYLFNAAPQHGRKQNGRTLLINHIIREYAGQEMLLDFESPNEREQDILHFYKSFGPEATPIPVLRYDRLPSGVRYIKEVRMRLVRRRRGFA
ncbi:GNAT family N-acetyltransferase [Pontibacter russatus]|uniref:GNAT family N-acetyltransferase n=1 Tax=Pontibacter russatus TaxID=2694929 RepID=UPI00137A20B8|nr:GNAT family N-acetyltransferase [Pontibacter russatus]